MHNLSRMEDIYLDSMDEVSLELLQTLIRKHKSKGIPRLKLLRRYYEGKHDILKRTFADGSKPNNRIVNNFCKMISDITQGYFMGTPVSYGGTDEEFLLYLQDIYNIANEQSVNSLLAKDGSIFGAGYELLYLDGNANIKMAPIKPEEVFMIFSTGIEREPIGAVRHYKIKNYIDETKYYENVEVYTDHSIRYYTSKGGTLHFVEEVPHYFGICPVIQYLNNDEEIGDFENIIGLQNAYNSAVSDQANDFEYTADSYLVITGAEDTEDEEFLNMKQNRLILLPETGEASWLMKTTDNATIESYKNRLTKDIHRFSNVPDINSEEFMNDISGAALKYRWQSMEQACANKERLFKDSLMLRQKAICNILAVKGLFFDYTSVTQSFKRNIPVNNTELVQMVQALTGVVSKETLFNLLPFVENAQDEIERIENENGMADVYEDSVFTEWSVPSEEGQVLPLDDDLNNEE